MLSTTIPNILTLGRIFLIPIVVVGFYLKSSNGCWLAFLAYSCACVTDFFDGYMARLWSQTSRFGQFLDPVADKLLVATSLLLLVGFERLTEISYVPALIILCREILVSGLREFLSDIRISVNVSLLAKWKTAIQMVSIGILMVAPIFTTVPNLQIMGEGLLWVSATLTIITGYDYCRLGLRHI